MTVNVDEIVSSVIPEPEESSRDSGPGTEPGWKVAAQIRAHQALNVWNRGRTSAEGFDD